MKFSKEARIYNEQIIDKNESGPENLPLPVGFVPIPVITPSSSAIKQKGDDLLIDFLLSELKISENTIEGNKQTIKDKEQTIEDNKQTIEKLEKENYALYDEAAELKETIVQKEENIEELEIENANLSWDNFNQKILLKNQAKQIKSLNIENKNKDLELEEKDKIIKRKELELKRRELEIKDEQVKRVNLYKLMIDNSDISEKKDNTFAFPIRRDFNSMDFKSKLEFVDSYQQMHEKKENDNKRMKYK